MNAAARATEMFLPEKTFTVLFTKVSDTQHWSHLRLLKLLLMVVSRA